MTVHEPAPPAAIAAYLDLFHRCRLTSHPTNGFTSLARSLVSGKFLYLRNHFSQRTFFLSDGGRDVLAAIAFISKSKELPDSLGGFLAIDGVSDAAVHYFLDQVTKSLPTRELLFPLNGHINFGVSALFPGEAPSKVAFMTSSHQRSLDHLFSYPGARLDRTYLALRTHLDEQVARRLKGEIQDIPAGVTTRPISLVRFRAEMRLHNSLVNQTMKDLPLFYPLSSDEWWDLMHGSWPLVQRDLFQFLCYDGREVGFCFAFLDFNRVMGSSADWLKALKVLALRGRGSRARIFSSGILPEYRRRGIFKYVRNRVLIALAERGVSTVESSYVDLENASSLGNVRSRGGELSHRFGIFRSRPREAPHP